MNPLSQLSNEALETRLKDLVQKERTLLHVILEHIKEVERRELYLAKAYSSMYAYLVQEMKYSGSAAMRRLEAARLLKDVPSLSREIQAGNVNLSQIGELSRALKDKERQQQKKVSSQKKAELIAKISQKSLPESQQILSESLEIPLKKTDTQKVQRDASVRLEITLTKAQHEALLKCKESLIPALKQQHQEISWGSVLEVLAAQYLKKKPGSLEKKTPEKKISENSSSVEPTSVAPPTTEAVTECNTKGASAKTLTPRLRREILTKTPQGCEFTDPRTGKRCGSSFCLQVDHRKPRWAGGTNDKTNLQVLCAAHNAYKYRQESFTRRRL